MPVLPLFAINALIMMAAAAGGLWPAMAPDWPRPALTHVALGLGILPLILAAMSHFVPVLTRSRATLPHTLSLVPLLAWLAAVLLIGSLSGDLPGPAPRHLAFLLAFSATAALLVWIELRRRHTVGQPHPGLYWYVAALLCLGLALLAVPLMNVWPAHYRALRLLHLHLNLLGFVGLTALGTLQVLLPTTLTQPDPQAAQRLRPGADLKFALAGTLLIALGAAIAPLPSLPGVALYLIPPLRMLLHWQRRYARRLWSGSAAATTLTLAALGLIGLLLLACGHAAGLLDAGLLLPAFLLAFLLPLVSGTVSQLLPVWLRPGPQRAWHEEVRASLGQWAAMRSALMVAGGWLLALDQSAGLGLAAAGILLLILGFLRTIPLLRSAPVLS